MSAAGSPGRQVPVARITRSVEPRSVRARPRLAEAALAAVTPRTITDPAALRAQLDEIVARGYAVADGELDVGFIAVAAPVYDAGRAVVAAVSVGGPALRIPPERRPEIVASLQVTARRISRRLGYRPG